MTASHALLPILLALALGCGSAVAEKADRDKPMNIEADALRYDDLRQTSVFTGRVVVTKGTILIRGARVDVRQDPEGYQFGVVIAEPGKRAYYRQKRDGVDEYIEGEAETIRYDSKADRVEFVQRAELRRYKGATLNDEMVGSLITYDNTTDVFTVDGNAAGPNPGSLASTGGRVRAMLTPRNTGAASATPTGPGATLRTSPALAGEKK